MSKHVFELFQRKTLEFAKRIFLSSFLRYQKKLSRVGSFGVCVLRGVWGTIGIFTDFLFTKFKSINDQNVEVNQWHCNPDSVMVLF